MEKNISSRLSQRNIILTGFMGSGKSSCGRMIARRLEIPFVDTDKRIEESAGKSISEIFAQDGEESFRTLETELLKTLLLEKGPFVLSVGGGMPLREENRLLLKKLGSVFYLKASPESVWERVRGNKSRPLLQTENPKQRILSLMEERKECYTEAADHEVDTDNRSPREVAEEVISIWKVG